MSYPNPDEPFRWTLSGLVDHLLERIDEDGVVFEDSDLQTALELKVQAYAAVYRQLKSESDAHRELAAHYVQSANRKLDNAEQLRARLLEQMARLDVKKIKTPTVTAYIQETKAVEVLDITIVPAQFMVQPPPRPDKEALRDALSSGPVLGAELRTNRAVRFR